MLAITDKPVEEEDSRPQPPSSSATIIGANDDLLSEILLRTPLKSLSKFKSVSKHWFSLISSLSLSPLNRRPSGLFLRKSPFFLCDYSSQYDLVSFPITHLSPQPKPSFNSLNFPSPFKILQSCNGLLLCYTFQNLPANTSRNYFIYNPTTRQFSTLPPLAETKSTVSRYGLAFDPSKTVHYTVVCFHSEPIHFNYCNRTVCYTYSPETRCWRSNGDQFETPIDIWQTDGVFWNGSLHWVSPSGASLRYDVDNHRLGTMPVVPGSGGRREKRRYRYFGESNGHLHLIENYRTVTAQFDVLEMEWDYSKWFVKYRVDLVGIVNAFPEIELWHRQHTRSINCYSYSILGLARGDNEYESLLLLHVPGKLLSYNLKDSSFRELHNLAPGKFHKKGSLQFGCFDAYAYLETVASV